jgi:hypothetical protein
MPEIANSAVHHPRSMALNEEQIFRLWSAAVKDDDGQLDGVIQRVYRDLFAYDRDRFEEVIYLTITRNANAGSALAEILNELPVSRRADLQLH